MSQDPARRLLIGAGCEAAVWRRRASRFVSLETAQRADSRSCLPHRETHLAPSNFTHPPPNPTIIPNPGHNLFKF